MLDFPLFVYYIYESLFKSIITYYDMIKFRKVTESDEQLNSQIEALNRKVFPSTETTANLHFLAGLYKGATVDFIAMDDDDVGMSQKSAMEDKYDDFYDDMRAKAESQARKMLK